MSDRWLDSAAEFWDIHTVPDDLESTLTMLMNREPPFIMIELWGASGGQFRTTYNMAGNDVVTVWPQGYSSNLTEWDNETLAEEMKKLSFAKPIGSNPFEIGSWVFRLKGPHILLTNKQQKDFEIYLTSKGFVFFDSSGYALVNQGESSSSTCRCPVSRLHRPFGYIPAWIMVDLIEMPTNNLVTMQHKISAVSSELLTHRSTLIRPV